MIAAINPAHAFDTVVSTILKVERQMNLITKAFFRWQRLAVLISSGRR